MSAPTITPSATPPADGEVVPEPVADTLVHEDLVEGLNALLAATEAQEGRRPLVLNAFGQWCTRDVYGAVTPHRSYAAAYRVAHSEEVA